MSRLQERLAAVACLIALNVPFATNAAPTENCAAWLALSSVALNYPGLAEACEDVVLVDGDRYVALRGKVRQKEHNLLLLQLAVAEHDVALAPVLHGDARRDAAAASTTSSDLATNDPVRVYVPEGDLGALLGTSGAVEAEDIPMHVERLETPAQRKERIANYTCCPRRRPWYPIPDVLPATDSPRPLPAWAGLTLLGLALGIRLIRSDSQ